MGSYKAINAVVLPGYTRPGKFRRQLDSYIGCQLHKKKVFSSPFRKKRYNDFALVQEGRFSRLGPLLFADSGPSEEFVWLARGKNYGFFA
jgi:hypothetical protein